jgi:hypothetical protein
MKLDVENRPPELNSEGGQMSFAAAEGSLEQQCLEFAQTLGLEQAVSRQVLEAALRDETYAHNLLASRRSPPMLKHLLANPPKPRIADARSPQLSNAELVRKAALALMRWGAVGFSTVDKVTLDRRRAACMSCPNLADPPDKLLYKLTAPDGSQKICSLCGCNVWKKTKLPTESCPASDLEHAGISRWGDPWRAAPEDVAL